jgi:hypothetical protein
MISDRFLVVGVKTAQREWFALSAHDTLLIEFGLEPNLARSERELRLQLKDLGLSEVDIEERFRNARKWMPSLTNRSALGN